MSNSQTKTRIIAYATTALLISIATAHATPTEFIGTYSVQYTPTIGNAPDITKMLSSPFTEYLDVGVTTLATDLLAVSPASSCGACGFFNTASGTINVSFNFTTPGPATAGDKASYFANYYFDTDGVNWNNPSSLAVNFADGALLDINLISATDWTIYPKISFDLIKAPTPVPEPASLAVLGGGLFVMAWSLRRRRKSRAGA